MALLKSNPALISSQDTNGWTPLHWAVRMGRKNVAEWLLANGAEVNAKASGVGDDRWFRFQPFFGKGNFEGLTPLHLAAISGSKDMVELLLNNKAEVDAKDSDGNTSLDYVADIHHKDMGELLLSHKASYNVFDVVAIGDFERVKALLQSNPNLASSKNASTTTPLHCAAERGLKDIMELLLACEADINATDYYGFTALHQAAMVCRQSGVAELLLAHGADVNAIGYEGQTPLHCAVNNQNKDVAEVLLAHGAEVNAKETNGWTPLYVAEYEHYGDVANLLRQHGGHE